MKDKPGSEAQLGKIVLDFNSPFFSLNGVSRETFLRALPKQEILHLIGSHRMANEPITFLDVFPETASITVAEARKFAPSLEGLDERVIQNAIRDALRDRNVTNAQERAHDSPIEVADHEHFFLEVRGSVRSFAGVVKGFDSIKGKTVTFEAVAHQIVKAYNRTKPDHILLVLAKNPADTVISEATEYGRTMGNVGLVILCDPVTLARFLRARKVL